MDKWQHVREINAGEQLADDRLAAARARVLARLDSPASSPRARKLQRPVWLVAGALVTAAAVTATVVVVAQHDDPTPEIEALPVVTPSPTPITPTPTPSSTSGATAVQEPFPGTTPAPGQYLRNTCRTEMVNYRDGYIRVFNWPELAEYAPISAALMASNLVEFLPADPTQDRIMRWGPHNERLSAYGPWDPASGQPLGDVVAWDNLAPFDPEVVEESWPAPRSEDGPLWSNVPRDPAGLIEFYGRFGPEPTLTPEEINEQVQMSLVSVLNSNSAPADLRAGVLEALMTVTPAASQVVEAGAITFQFSFAQGYWPRSESATVDLATGWVRESAVRYDRGDRADEDPVPSNIPDIWRTCSVEIVDGVW